MPDSIGRAGASRELVYTILEDVELACAVRELDVDTLGTLIRHIGLEDCAELLSLATAEQLCGLADDELWRAADAEDFESFDAERFAIWLDVLFEAGSKVAVRAFLALDEDLLTHALAQHMLVLDLDSLAPVMSGTSADEDELGSKLLEACLTFEIDELVLVSRGYDGWDALIEVLCELDIRHRDFLRRVLERLCAASMDRVADDGLFTVLSEAETLAEDALAGREERRERRGFVAASDAQAFLKGARERPREAAASPTTRSYFRHYQPTVPARGSAALSRLTSILQEQGAVPVRALPAWGEASSPTRLALAELRDREPVLHSQLVAELVYLANLLMSGKRLDGEPMGQVDALTAALVFTDLGLVSESEARLENDKRMVELFALGWSRAAEENCSSSPLMQRARELLGRIL